MSEAGSNGDQNRTTLDRILAVLAIGSMVAFLGVVIGFVPRLNLFIVLLVVVLLAAYDFYRDVGPRRSRNSR